MKNYMFTIQATAPGQMLTGNLFVKEAKLNEQTINRAKARYVYKAKQAGIFIEEWACTVLFIQELDD